MKKLENIDEMMKKLSLKSKEKRKARAKLKNK
jgi:hypothetical protein